MKKLLAIFFIAALVLVPTSLVFAGGDETADDSMRDTQKALEDQIYKNRDLEDKLGDLQKQINDLKNQPPQVVTQEKIVEKEGAYTLPIHGFFNTNYADSNFPGEDNSYDQENFNIYFDYLLDEQFHFFGELGYKHGTEIDVDLNSVYGVGEVNVVQAWLDWKFSKAAVLKFGKFLTPYGKWNLEHSPAIYLSIYDPIVVRRDIFPKTVTGVQFYGERPLGAVDLLYNVYTGNGKGYRAHSFDDNTNKGVGARMGILSSFMNLGTFEVGASGYYGRDGTLNDEDQNVLGWDATLNIYPFQLRTEYATSDYMLPTGDWESNAWFVQGSYNFLEKYDAYLRYDKEDTDEDITNIGDMAVTSVGLNYKPIPKVAFKIEYNMYDQHVAGTYEVIGGSVAVEF